MKRVGQINLLPSKKWLPMLQSLLPFILASLGSTIILWATSMPLFEWQISQLASDFPSTYEVHALPSPWITRLGNSLDDSSYISQGQVYVSKDGISCNHKNLSFIAKRPQNDARLERISLNFSEKNSPWLYVWGGRVIILSMIYIWWFTISYEHRSFFVPLILTIIATIFYVELTQVVRTLLPRVVPLEYLGMLDCYHGTVTFNARLAAVHYETILVFFVGTLLELVALGVMLYAIMKVVMGRKKVSN